MSERFQKNFISAREFIESWDKELYELNNLDYFIYLMINHLGNQLEKRFFTPEKQTSQLFLDFDNIGTVCFNIGDTFQYFLEENCFGSCPLNCPTDLKNTVAPENQRLSEEIKRKISILRSFADGSLNKEQCLRIDLLNNVILDTLLSFYNDDFHVNIEEDNLELLDLAEFFEEVMIAFIKLEGQTLLKKPLEFAMNHFEDLLDRESETPPEDGWQQDENEWLETSENENWKQPVEQVENVFDKFTKNQYYYPSVYNPALIHDIHFFKRYLLEHSRLTNIYDLNEMHLG
ncbi:MAG: hypothetical protein WAN36_13100, partial [Calditrichia bacterium]